MARLFVKSHPDYITLTALPSILSNITIACWYNNASLPSASSPNQFALVSRANATNLDVNYGLGMNNNSLYIYYTTASNTFVGGNLGNITPDTGVWHHAVVSTNFTSFNAYIDGVLQGTGTGSFGAPGTPENIGTRPTIGVGGDLTTNPYDGRLADIAIWSVQLSALEIASLAKGIRPYMVRPASLGSWWPLDGLSSPEADLIGFASGTPTGTSLAFGPPISTIGPPLPMTTPFTAGPSFNPARAMGKNIVIGGVAT